MAKFPDEPAFGLSSLAESPDAPDIGVQDNAPAMHALEIAKADSQYLLQTKELRDVLAGEAEPDGLREKYEPLFRQAYDNSAAQISDPEQRDIWAQGRLPDFDGHVLAASDRVFGLEREREITSAATQLNAMRELAVQTSDPAQRSEFIQAANGLIFGLQAAGYIDEVAAKEKQKGWAQDFALAAFTKLPVAEQVKWLEGDAQERGAGKGELIDFVPAEMRESLLQTAQLNLRKEEQAAQSTAALERHDLESQIRDDLAAILKEGKGLDSLAPEKVQTILGPDALRDWQETREDFRAIRKNTEDLYALTDTQVDERLQSLLPSDDMRDDPRKGAIFLEVQRQADAMRRLRASDPAKSVAEDPLVRAASDAQAQSDNPQAQRDLYAARLAAQERAGIARDAQSPITKDEALPLIAPLEGARPGQERDVLTRVSATFNEQFGANAEQAFAFALRAQQSEAEEIFATMRAVRSMGLGGERQRPIYDEIAADLEREDQLSIFEGGNSSVSGRDDDLVRVAGIRDWIFGKRPSRKPTEEAGGEPSPPRFPLPDIPQWRRRDPQRGDEPSFQPTDANSTGRPVITAAEAEELRRRVAAKALPDEIVSLPVIRNAVAYMDTIPPTGTAADFERSDYRAARIFDFDGERVVGYDGATARLIKIAREYSKDGAVRNQGVATIVIGQPAAGKSTFSRELARIRYAAIVDSDDAKKSMREYTGGLGTTAVHVESGVLAQDVLAKLESERANLVIPTVGANAGALEGLIGELRASGYAVDLVHVNVSADEAMRRNAIRYLDEGRLVHPEYIAQIASKPHDTYNMIKMKGAARETVEIDNNGPIGTAQVTDGDAGGEIARYFRTRRR